VQQIRVNVRQIAQKSDHNSLASICIKDCKCDIVSTKLPEKAHLADARAKNA